MNSSYKFRSKLPRYGSHLEIVLEHVLKTAIFPGSTNYNTEAHHIEVSAKIALQNFECALQGLGLLGNSKISLQKNIHGETFSVSSCRFAAKHQNNHHSSFRTQCISPALNISPHASHTLHSPIIKISFYASAAGINILMQPR